MTQLSVTVLVLVAFLNWYYSALPALPAIMVCLFILVASRLR
jgi:hypothetical protein